MRLRDVTTEQMTAMLKSLPLVPLDAGLWQKGKQVFDWSMKYASRNTLDRGAL